MVDEEAVQNYVKQFELELQQERLARIDAQNKLSQMSAFQSSKENVSGMEYQLDVSPTLDRIYHLLSGHVLMRNEETGKTTWEEPNDDRLKILTDYGVKQIMNILSNYISPDTLLANLTEEQVYWITRDFGIEVADFLFNRYELFYYHPSPEELFEKYKKVMKDNNMQFTDGELYQKCVQWSREELQMKFRHYPMHINMITSKVFINLTRAINGKERESLRKQYMINENIGNPTMPQPKQKSSIWSRS